jgi:hypothetical protein
MSGPRGGGGGRCAAEERVEQAALLWRGGDVAVGGERLQLERDGGDEDVAEQAGRVVPAVAVHDREEQQVPFRPAGHGVRARQHGARVRVFDRRVRRDARRAPAPAAGRGARVHAAA